LNKFSFQTRLSPLGGVWGGSRCSKMVQFFWLARTI